VAVVLTAVAAAAVVVVTDGGDGGGGDGGGGRVLVLVTVEVGIVQSAVAQVQVPDRNRPCRCAFVTAVRRTPHTWQADCGVFVDMHRQRDMLGKYLGSVVLNSHTASCQFACTL
jgi:hypothetical protein